MAQTKIGQIRKNSSSSTYYAPITVGTGYYKSSIIPNSSSDSEYYTTSCIINGLTKGKSYYLKILIDRMTGSQSILPGGTAGENNDYNLQYDIWLGKVTGEPSGGFYTNFEKIQQLRNDVPITSFKEGSAALQGNIDLVFSVNNEQVNSVYIELVTRPCDYINNTHGEPQSKAENGRVNSRLDWLRYKASINAYELKNILSLETGMSAEKIGVQSRPGQMIVVNKEPIRIGRSGIYEINNGLRVNWVSIVPDGELKIPNFIIDYVTSETPKPASGDSDSPSSSSGTTGQG